MQFKMRVPGIFILSWNHLCAIETHSCKRKKVYIMYWKTCQLQNLYLIGMIEKSIERKAFGYCGYSEVSETCMNFQRG